MKKFLQSILALLFATALIQAQNPCKPTILNDCITIPHYIDSVLVTNAIVNFTNDKSDCSTTDENYVLYKGKIATEAIGSTFNLRIAQNYSNPAYLGVWIDWNDDLTFTIGEQVYFSTGTISAVSLSVTVPTGAVQDTVIIRVRSAASLIDACNLTNSGETEDYYLIVQGPLSIKNTNLNTTEWTLFPNPSSGTFNLEIKNLKGAYEIKICDILGNEVLSQKSFNQHQEFDFSNFSKGIYFVTLNHESKNSVKKILLE